MCGREVPSRFRTWHLRRLLSLQTEFYRHFTDRVRRANKYQPLCNDDVTISGSCCSHLGLRGPYSATCASEILATPSAASPFTAVTRVQIPVGDAKPFQELTSNSPFFRRHKKEFPAHSLETLIFRAYLTCSGRHKKAQQQRLLL